MALKALTAALHYIALGIGLGAIYMRGHYLGSVSSDAGNARSLKMLFKFDGFWILALVLWIVTGMARAFGGWEKSRFFYLHNPPFLAKMALFVLLLFFEILPMSTFLQWRWAKKRSLPLPNLNRISTLMLLNDFEMFIVLITPFISSMMARGIGGVF